jgi:hypothetical protein
MPFKIKDGLAVGSVVSLTSSGIVTNAAFSVADGTNGFLKKTGVNTWTVDTNTYVTSSGVTSVSGTAPVVSSGGTTPAISMAAATASVNGYMTSTYASKLDGIAAGAQVNVATNLGYTTGANGGTVTSSTGSSASLPVATAALAGLMDSTDKSKLNGIAAGATANVGTVTSVGGTGSVSGLSLSGTVTSTGNLTLSGTLAVTASNFASQTAKYALVAPTAADGVPTFRQLIWDDVSNKPTVFAPTSHTHGDIANDGTYSSKTAKYALIAPNGAAGVPTFRQILFSDLTSTPTTVSGYGITDAYTKTEVDGLVTGLDFKQSVRAATTANITLSATQTIDGVAVVAGNRVLVKDQSTSSQNGIYVVAAGAWSRSTDADNTPAGEVTAGMYCFVEEGTTNADSGWVLTTNDAITLGTTSLVFAQFNGLGQVNAGTGLSKTGNTLNHSNSVTGATIAEGGSTRTLASGGTFNVPSVTYDAQGHITASTSVALTLPASTNNVGTVTSVSGTAPVSVATGTSTPVISMAAASSGVNGYMTGTYATKLDGIAAGAQVNVATNLSAGTVTATTYPLNSSTGTGVTLAAATGSLAGLMVAADKTKLDGIATGAQVNVAADLAYTTAASNGTVTSSTGTDATIPAATTSLAGLLTGADKTKLDGIATGATANVGTVTSVSGTAPVSVATGTSTPVISMAAATASVHGYMTSTYASKLDGIATGAQVNVATNLSAGTVTATTYPLNSSTGTGVTLAAATGSLAGLMVAADKTKLDASTASATNSTIVLRDGSGNFAANIVTAEGVNLDSTIHSKYATATVATVAETVLDSWAGATYRTCKYLVQIAQGTDYQSSEILVIHNGTTTSMTEYAIVETNTNLATFSCDYSGGNARLKVVMGSATSAAFKMNKTLIVV